MAAMFTENDYVPLAAAAAGALTDDQPAFGVGPLFYRLSREEKSRLRKIQAEKRDLRRMETKNEETATNAVSGCAWTTAVFILFLVYYSPEDSNDQYQLICFTFAVIGSLLNGLSYHTTLQNVYHRTGVLKQMEVRMGYRCRDFLLAVEESAAAAGAAVDGALRLKIEALQKETIGHSGFKLMEAICVALICFTGIGFAGLFMYSDYFKATLQMV